MSGELMEHGELAYSQSRPWTHVCRIELGSSWGVASALLLALLCDCELVTKPAWVTVSLSDEEMVELANSEGPFSSHLPSVLEMKCHNVGNQ